MASFYEDTTEQGNSAFGWDVSRSTRTYILQETETEVAPGAGGSVLEGDHPTVQDIQDKIDEILGGTDTEVGSGALHRGLPLADPQYNYLYAESVTSVRPIPNDLFSQEAADAELEAPPIHDFCQYKNYKFTIEFLKPPYDILDDDEIIVETIDWYDSDGTRQTNRVAHEYVRYTDYVTKTREDIVTWTEGEMRFRTGGTKTPDPNNTPYAGLPTIYLPNQTILFTWYKVPYRYVTSPRSFLERFKGRINQTAFMDWPRASLFYKNYDVKRYGPPKFSTEKLCDITFEWILTRRESTDPPNPDNIQNLNWIPEGHNLQPWFGSRGFYYTTSRPDREHTPATAAEKLKWFPTWYSFPFALLFTDPDSKQDFFGLRAGGP